MFVLQYQGSYLPCNTQRDDEVLWGKSVDGVGESHTENYSPAHSCK